MPSTHNSKVLQSMTTTDEGRAQLGLANYYKYRAGNLMFGFNVDITSTLGSFCTHLALHCSLLPAAQACSNLCGCLIGSIVWCGNDILVAAEFNALRKNQLLKFYHELQPLISATEYQSMNYYALCDLNRG